MRKSKGFTLVELLIVIAIIGILAAIAIPNLLTAVQRGRQKRTMADMRTIATALEAYAVDNNVYPSAACPAGTFTGPAQPLTEGSLKVLLKDDTDPQAGGYMNKIPWNDGWGHPYHYATDTPKQQYVLISTGRDGVPDGTINCITTTNFNDDIVYSNGSFIQWPEGIQK